MKEGGVIELKSLRRVLNIDVKNLTLIEGPHFPIGFIRFKMEREKIYLFSLLKNGRLQRILYEIISLNPEIKYKNINFDNRTAEGF